MVNILFIAFEFPPLNRGGVFRSLAFTKYLPQFGINPIVITLHRESYDNVYDVYSCDNNLGKEVLETATVLQAKADKPLTQSSRLGTYLTMFFSIHGLETKYWEDDFYKVAGDAIKTYNIKAIMATVPPFSVLPLASQLSRQYTLPLIYDFRDAWSQWRMSPYITKAHYWANLSLERKYFNEAAKVIATSKETLADFIKLHPAVNKEKFHYIPNGYNGELETWQPLDISRKEIVIGYVGSFYYVPESREQMLRPWWKKKPHRMLQYIPQRQDWLYRTPYFFFSTLKQLFVQSPGLTTKLKIRFIGKRPEWLEAMIKEFELQEHVMLLGEKTHADAIAFQKECDMLLITSAKRIGGNDYSIAGKTFEYIQSQKPILAFVCDGAQKDILADSGMALMCNPDDTAANVQKIGKLLQGETTLSPDYDFIKTLSRQYLTKQLSDIIIKTISN